MLCSFSLQLIFFSEQPFYGSYSTVISHTFARSTAIVSPVMTFEWPPFSLIAGEYLVCFLFYLLRESALAYCKYMASYKLSLLASNCKTFICHFDFQGDLSHIIENLSPGVGHLSILLEAVNVVSFSIFHLKICLFR